MMALTSGARWHVVKTHPRAETKAAEHLRRQGFGTYLPRYLKHRRHARRVETVPAPLFPCYLFVAVDIAVQRWRSIQSSIGVLHLVCSGNAPAVLPMMSSLVLSGAKVRTATSRFIGGPSLRRAIRFAFMTARSRPVSVYSRAKLATTASQFCSNCWVVRYGFF
jgi:hypothetical protein